MVNYEFHQQYAVLSYDRSYTGIHHTIVQKNPPYCLRSVCYMVGKFEFEIHHTIVQKIRHIVIDRYEIWREKLNFGSEPGLTLLTTN